MTVLLMLPGCEAGRSQALVKAEGEVTFGQSDVERIFLLKIYTEACGSKVCNLRGAWILQHG